MRSTSPAQTPHPLASPLPLALATASTLLAMGALAGLGMPPASLAQASRQAAPPQLLPIGAEWCLDSPSPAPPKCIALEVAADARQQSWGLQQRSRLPHRRGMWFPFDTPRPTRFWMHLTPEPLDMLFVGGGRVVAIEASAQPCMRLPCRSYGPDVPVEGVVELAAGEAQVLGLKVGSGAVIKRLASPQPASP